MRKILKRRSARVAVWAAGGVLGAGAIGLLAAPATASTPTVTYDGGCSVLSSTSAPDDDSLRVRKPSGGGPARVKVVNDMNAPATPYANGRAVTTSDGKALVIGKDGDSATIPFASGPVDLVLKPRCGVLGLDTSVLKKDYDAARISVLQPASSGGSGDNSSGGGSESGGGTESGSNSGGSGDSGSGAGDKPAAPKEPVARGAEPEGADGEAPDSGDSDGSVGAPAADDDNKAGGNGEAAPIVNASHNRGPGTTTLALIAAVCLLGVGAAAFRTILVTRAARVSYN